MGLREERHAARTLEDACARRLGSVALRRPTGRIAAGRASSAADADVMRDGMTLFGGGSLLRGFAQRLGEETQLATRLAGSPLTCVAEGAGRSLEEF